MKYLEKSLQFLGKNYLLVLPLLLALVIPALMLESAADEASDSAKGTIERISDFVEKIQESPEDYDDVENPGDLYELLFEDVVDDFSDLIKVMLQAAFFAFILGMIAQPMTYGLVNRGLNLGKGDIKDAGTSLGENIIKYIIFVIARAVLWVLIAIGMIIFFVIVILIASKLGKAAFIVMLVSSILIFGFGLLISIVTKLWYPAMIVEDLGVIEAFKKAFSIGKSKFWTLLGVGILVTIAGAIGGFIFGFFAFMPYIGTVIGELVPAISAFIMIVFYIMVYRDQVGLKIEEEKPALQAENLEPMGFNNSLE